MGGGIAEHAASAIPLWMALGSVAFGTLASIGAVVTLVIKSGKEKGRMSSRLESVEKNTDGVLGNIASCQKERRDIEGKLFEITRGNKEALAAIASSINHIGSQMDHIQERVDHIQDRIDLFIS